MNDAAALDTNPTSNDTANLDDIFDQDDDDPDSSMDDDDDDNDENNAMLDDGQTLNESNAVSTSQPNEQSKENTST